MHKTVHVIITNDTRSGYFAVKPDGTIIPCQRNQVPRNEWFSYPSWADFWEDYDEAIRDEPEPAPEPARRIRPVPATPRGVDTSAILEDDQRPGRRQPPPERGQYQERAAPARARSQSGRAALFATSIMLLIPGLIGWLADAKYTTSGWLKIITMFSIWLNQPVTLTMPAKPAWFFTTIIAVGLVYSLVEFGSVPPRWGAYWRTYRSPVMSILIALGFLFAIVTDLISTVFDILYPSPGASAPEVWLSSRIVLASIWAIVIAFLPEYAVFTAVRLLRSLRR